MRYYIIGNKDSSASEYSCARLWLIMNGNTVINPFTVNIKGITDSELAQVKMLLLSFADAVLVLDKSCDTYELSYAKALGKKIKYLSKQWKLKQKKSNDTYKKENI